MADVSFLIDNVCTNDQREIIEKVLLSKNRQKESILFEAFY